MRKNKENGGEVIFKDRETKNFFIDFSLIKNISPKPQEAQQVSWQNK